MFYTYVLLSNKDKKFYVGYTNNLEERVQQHNNGYVPSTANRRPLELVYYEAYKYKQDATNQEQFYKTGQGRSVLRSRLHTITEKDK